MLVQHDRLPAVHRLSFEETTGSLDSGDHSLTRDNFNPLSDEGMEKN